MAFSTFAAISIGGYEIVMEIFEISRKNGIRSIDKIRHKIDLGRDTFSMGKISAEQETILIDVLTDFKNIMRGYQTEGYKAIAGSALREASNGLFVLGKIKSNTGIEVRVLSNSEQRLLDYKAAAAIEEHFNKIIEKGTAFVDLDGGSLQISLFDKDALVTTQNIRLGNLRVRERLSHVETSTISYENLVEEFVGNELAGFRKMFLKDRNIEHIILAGDLFTRNMFRSFLSPDASPIVSKEELTALYQQIVGLSPTELAMRMQVPLENASLMIPSAIIYKFVIDLTGAQRIWIPGISITQGLAYEYAEQNHLIRNGHNFENDILMAARNLGKRYAVNKPHVNNLDMIAMELFEAVRKRNGYTAREKLLLKLAVMLHDVGKYISLNNVADCSYQIIMANEIIGLSHSERHIVALAAKYNTSPLPGYADFREQYSLTVEEYLIVAGLTAILRLANALDRSHKQKVEQVRAVLKDNDLNLNLSVNSDFSLERGLCKDKIDFFYEVFSIRVNLKTRRTV